MTPKETIIKFLEDQNFTITTINWPSQLVYKNDVLISVGHDFVNIYTIVHDPADGRSTMIVGPYCVEERAPLDNMTIEYCDPEFFGKLSKFL